MKKLFIFFIITFLSTNAFAKIEGKTLICNVESVVLQFFSHNDIRVLTDEESPNNFRNWKWTSDVEFIYIHFESISLPFDIKIDRKTLLIYDNQNVHKSWCELDSYVNAVKRLNSGVEYWKKYQEKKSKKRGNKL